MKKKLKTKSLTTKSILIILVFSIIFMLIALPITETITYNIFNPYLIENIMMRISNSAVLMSTFLAQANPDMYIRTLWNDELHKQILNLESDAITRETFAASISETIAPYETTLPLGEDESFVSTNYPVIYIEGEGVFCDPTVEEAANSIINSDWFKDYKEWDYYPRLYPPVETQDGSGEQSEYFAYVYGSYADENSEHPFFSILLTKYTDIFPLWDSVFELGIRDFAFINLNFDIVYQQGDFTNDDLSWIWNNMTTGRQHHVITNEDTDVMTCSVLVSYESEGLRFIARIPTDIYYSLFENNSLYIQLIIFVLVVVFILIAFIILRQIFKRLTALSEKMAVVQEGNYNVKLDDSSEDEIGQLASTFNIMTSKIQDNVNELVEKEKREKMLQYNLMVSAIDPHFIYNTLNTSTRLAELGRADEVVIVNDALINCLKDNLKMKNFQSFDTVANEIDALEQYITIQNYLCDNTVSLEQSISDDDMQLKIPKFLLQPLVENSILHGILMNIDKDGNMIAGKIKIDVKQANERIRISIKDNGIGMSQETIEKYFYTDENVILNEKAHFEHIGVLNMRTRLSYLYNDNYSVNVNSQPGKGTEIVIEIPIS